MNRRYRKTIIAGNWKMNLDHLEAVTLVQRLTWLLTDADHDQEAVEVAVFPPFTGLRSVQTLVTGDRLDLVYGAQDLSPEDAGAYTGDVSGAFLAALGCRYAIVGHSERRTLHGEDDALVVDHIIVRYTVAVFDTALCLDNHRCVFLYFKPVWVEEINLPHFLEADANYLYQ